MAIEGVSIIMPAHGAEATIAEAVGSALEQDVPLEVIVAADDGVDYRAVLAAAGIADDRLVFTATDTPGSGASAARNAALAVARMRYAAALDADDAFAPGKLARTLPALRDYGLVSTALAIVDEDGALLRELAVGPDRLLPAPGYKFTNLSMDSMILWDRERADPRYGPAMACMNDLDFLMRLFGALPASFHIGAPLHLYRKRTRSISNGPGVAERMIAAKTRLRQRLAQGYYPFADPDTAKGLDAFLSVSLEAERSFASDPAAPGPQLFENHLEPLLGRTGYPYLV